MDERAIAGSGPAMESHAIRLSFEQWGTVLVLFVLGAACAIALLACWPAHWADVVADHVNKISGALLSFVSALAGVLGLSWGRGHLDERLKT
jgi:hypothetical protein